MIHLVRDDDRRRGEPSHVAARDAMDRDFAEPLAIGDLAFVACVSESNFIRTFKSVFGETPHRYLQRRRIERAMYMLRTTDRSVTDICMSVGFSSLGSFTRTFRDIVGESPAGVPHAKHARRGSVVFREGVGETEQFWRSPLMPSDVTSMTCSTRSPARRCSSSTRTKRSSSTPARSASMSSPIWISASCDG